MSANSQENDKKYSLEVSLPGLLPPSENNLLRSGFAYLLRSSLSMVDLYPWLGQLLFRSKAVETDQLDNLTGSPDSSVNVVGVFVDDSWKVMRFNLAKGLNVEDDKKMVKRHLLDYAPMAAWMDTFGSFGADSSLEKPDPDGWFSQSIPGAGNPMRMFRFVREIYEKESEGKVNVFLLSSLSNLSRNIGLPETVAFLTAVLNEVIWNPLPDSGESSSEGETKPKPIKMRDGVFVAVLQEGVLREDEASSVESFFDGIIRFEMHPRRDPQNNSKATSPEIPFLLPSFEVQRLPGVTFSQEAPRRCIYIPANAKKIKNPVLDGIRYVPSSKEDKHGDFIKVYEPRYETGPTGNGQKAPIKASY